MILSRFHVEQDFGITWNKKISLINWQSNSSSADTLSSLDRLVLCSLHDLTHSTHSYRNLLILIYYFMTLLLGIKLKMLWAFYRRKEIEKLQGDKSANI